MLNSQEQAVAWAKVVAGLDAAGLSGAIAQLKEIFDGMPAEDAAKVMASGHIGDSWSEEYRVGRNLYRALNFLLALQAKKQHRLAWEAPVETKDKFRNAGAQWAALAPEVRQAYAALFPPAPAAASAVPVPDDSGRVTPGIRPAIPAMPGAREREIQLRQVERLKAVHQAIHLETHLRSNAPALHTTWTQARSKIQAWVADDTHWLLFNFSELGTALQQAYRNFNQIVSEDRAATQGRLDLIKTLFDALKAAPPPISAVGAIGAVAIGQVRPDNYDPAAQYRALEGADTPFFIRHMAGAMKEFQRLRTMTDLSHITRDTEITAVMTRLTQVTLEVMKIATDAALDEVFGTPRNSAQKLQTIIDRYVADPGRSLKSPSKHQQQLVEQIVTQYSRDATAQIQAAFAAPSRMVSPDDLRIGIEMYLCCQYAIDLFHHQPQSAKLRPVNDRLVNFFAQTGDWGIMKLNEDDHAVCTAQHRLRWNAGDDHKRSLVLFCAWYVKNINPFHMITGAMRDGRPYDAKLIKELCHLEVDRINQAINGGRTVNFIGWSSWDWVKIHAIYTQLCQRSASKAMTALPASGQGGYFR